MYATTDSDICAVLIFVVQCEVEIILCLLERVPRIQPDIAEERVKLCASFGAVYTPFGCRDSTPGLPPGSRKPLDSRCQTQHSGYSLPTRDSETSLIMLLWSPPSSQAFNSYVCIDVTSAPPLLAPYILFTCQGYIQYHDASTYGITQLEQT